MLNPARIQITEQTIIHRAGVQIEQHPVDGQAIHELHLDVVNGDTAHRYTIRFDTNGWEHFRSTVLAHGAGLTLARSVPDTNGQ
jgi:hypothetical protein